MNKGKNVIGDYKMNKEYICYCGLYCGNCAVKVKVEPAEKFCTKR